MANETGVSEYLKVDEGSRSTSQKIVASNERNQFTGEFKISDQGETKDIRDVFLRKDAVDEIEAIDTSDDGPGFTMDTLAQKFNQLLTALKSSSAMLLACLVFGGVAYGDGVDGKAKLRYIGANQYVVTNEVDGVFNAWKNTQSPLAIGYNTQLTRYGSLAIGFPGNYTNFNAQIYNQNLVTAHNESYSQDYDGPAVAGNYATALGQGAQARDQVSVAIGNRAMASGIHTASTDESAYFNIDLLYRQIVTTKQGSTVVSVVTNQQVKPIRMDSAEWETKPYGSGSLVQVNTITGVLPNGLTVTTNFYEETVKGLKDYRYADPEEYKMYDIYFEPGQPNTHFAAATYGVAVGYRALAGAYHTLALGHYARAARPHAVAIGPSSHIRSEGSIGLGYYNNISPNSPFSLAIGSRISIPQGYTNAIVIGVPTCDFSKRFKEGYKDTHSPYVFTSQPKPMKSNSINFVFNGNGLDDVFIDNVPMTDRMANDIHVVGNVGTSLSASSIKGMINEMAGISTNEQPIVFFSRDGGVKIYTQKYLDVLEDESEYTVDELLGDVSEVEINGKPLDAIIRRVAAESGNQGFEEYHVIVTNAAAQAQSAIGSASNMQDIKTALNSFFNSIK